MFMETKNKIRNYSEADLILLLNLQRFVGEENNPLLQQWLNVETQLTPMEQFLFDEILVDAKHNIHAWHEEDLKMKFIAFVLRLAHLTDSPEYHTYFEKTLSATIDGHFLKTKTDFMVAKGILDKPQQPYFHFQEWKPHKRPTGDSMAQLLEALLIAQEINQHKFPMYGCEVMGKQWSFVILEGKSYCLSKSYDCTEQDDLLKIIAILRHFRHLLLTQFLAR